MRSARIARDRSALALAVLMSLAGVLHLVRPAAYDALIPHALGRPRPWVLGSGAVELACGVGVAAPATRRAAAWATAALLVAVLPGNVTMAWRSLGASPARQAVTWGRLPLQVPLVLWAARVARRAG